MQQLELFVDSGMIVSEWLSAPWEVVPYQFIDFELLYRMVRETKSPVANQTAEKFYVPVFLGEL